MDADKIRKLMDETNALLEALLNEIPDYTVEQCFARAQIEGNAMSALAETAALLGLYDDEMCG